MGVFFGAVMALLYAPEAGDELRTKLQSSAQSGWEKVQTELVSMKDTAQQTTDQTQAESPKA
jgi:gas vesicle protein